MDIWYKYLATNVAIALIMLISGKIFSNRAPKNINTFIGYRTTMSMKNRDTWEFAHKTSGKLLWKCGWICLLAVVAVMFFLRGRPEETLTKVGLILCCAQIIPFIGISVHTENALRKAFDEDGNRRIDV